MSKSNTADRLKYLMKKEHLRQIDILNMCKPYSEKYGVKISKSDLSQYCSGKVEPKQNKLHILSMALNVNGAWLMGFDVPMELNENIKSSNSTNGNKDIPSGITAALNNQKWQQEFKDITFTEKEIEKIIDFARYIISLRGKE